MGGALVIASPPSWSGRALSGNWDVIRHYALIHLRYTVIAVGMGAAMALPLAYVSFRWPRTYPSILSLSNVLYAIPSVAMFVMLSPFLGFTNDKPVVVAMAIYTLVILVRNMVEGLRAVPPSVVDAATAMGYRPIRRFATVELPLALPGIIAGLRLATVSTISLISVAAVVGRGGLGRLFDDGFARDIDIEVWAGLGAIVVLALAMDLLIVGVGRLATPWTRAAESGTP
jgi:osmoprotectant transport system permease protein